MSLEDPDVCFQVPDIHVLGLCLDFNNMRYSSKEVDGCVELGAKVLGAQVLKIPLGCFTSRFRSSPETAWRWVMSVCDRALTDTDGRIAVCVRCA